MRAATLLVGLLLAGAQAAADGPRWPAPPFRPDWYLSDADEPARSSRPLGRTEEVHANGYYSEKSSRLLALDGRRMVEWIEGGKIRVWDVALGNPRWRREITLPEKVSLVCAALAGDVLLLGMGDGRILRWDLATGRALSTLRRHEGEIRRMAVSLDGTRLAVCFETSVQLWRLPEGTADGVLEDPHQRTIERLAFSHDGRRLAACAGQLVVWSLADRKAVEPDLADDRDVNDVAFSADGRWLFGIGSQGLYRWDGPTYAPQRPRPDSPRELSVIRAAPGGGWLALASENTSRVYLTGADGTGPVRRLRLRGMGDAPQLAWTANGDWLIAAADRGGLRAWHAASGGHVDPTRHDGGVRAVAADPRGRWLASAGGDDTVRLWDPATGWQRALRGGTEAHPMRALSALVAGPDGRALVVGGASLTRLALPDLTPVGPAFEPPTDTVRALALTPDGRTLIGAGDAGDVELWDTATGRRRMTLRGLTGPVLTLAVSPDGRWLAAGGMDHRGVAVWSLPDGSTIGRLSVLGWRVLDLAVSPDGRQLVVATGNGLWIGHPDRELTVFGGTDDQGVYRAARFAADGRSLLCLRYGNDVVRYDLGGKRIGATRLPGHPTDLTVVGHEGATGQGDGSLRVFAMPTPEAPESDED